MMSLIFGACSAMVLIDVVAKASLSVSQLRPGASL